MKNLLTILLISAFCFNSEAQKDVSLHINHLSGTDTLKTDGTTYSTGNGIYKLTRFRYYLSQIEIIHDGGQTTAVQDTYLLVDVNQNEYPLGTYNVTNIESIRFYIGIDSAHNHLDPSTYPNWHPLANKTPTMHWGWTAGYKLLAWDGFAASNGDTVANVLSEFHPVGDNYYTEQNVTTTAAVATNGNNLTIHIDGNYDLLFMGVDMASISHGAGTVMDRLMDNFLVNSVFTGTNLVSVNRLPDVLSFEVMPNPVHQQATIDYRFETTKKVDMLITDALGRVVQQTNNLAPEGQLNVEVQSLTAGVYHCAFLLEGKVIASKQLIKQ